MCLPQVLVLLTCIHPPRQQHVSGEELRPLLSTNMTEQQAMATLGKALLSVAACHSTRLAVRRAAFVFEAHAHIYNVQGA